MSWLKDNKMFIFLIYVNVLFILILVKVCYKIVGFDYLYVSILIIIGIMFYWFSHSVLKRRVFKFIFIILLISSGAAYYFLKSSYVIKLVNEQLINNLIYINSLVNAASTTSFISFKPIFIVAVPLIIFIITFLTSKGLYNSILIFNFAIITTLWYLGYTEEIKKYLFYYILVTLITYCTNSYKKNVKKLHKKGVKVTIDNKRILIYTIILCVFIAEITNYIPQDFKGKYSSDLKGKFINKFVQNVENEEDNGKKLKYDLSYSGYNKSSKKLGGPISVDKSIAFRVRSDGAYYLKGSVKDYYDGFIWSQTDVKYIMQSEKDKSMLRDNFSKSFFDESKSMTIYPEGLDSSTLFIPNFAYNADIEKGGIFYDDIPTFITGSVIKKPYFINYYDLNAEGLNISGSGIAKDKREVGVIFYSDWYKKYLELPNNISQRTYDLVYDLTKDKKYNYEKVQAIKDYLNTNFKYTLKVSDVPEGQEFLDYFLFTEKKGYCTYFATAETIMCRIAGIPARYVEGFNMTYEKDKNGLYIVRNENAHAWTEVLYMQNPLIGLWYTVDAVPNAVDYIHKEEEDSKINLGGGSGNKGSGIKIPSKNFKEDDGATGTLTLKETIPTNVLYSLYVITIIIFINLIFMLLFIIKRQSLFSKASNIPLYKYSLKRIESIGIKKPISMSEMEFINSMGEGLSSKVREIAVLAYNEYYGEKKPQQFNKKLYYKYIEVYIKKRQNKFVFYIKKYYIIGNFSLTKDKIMILYKKIEDYFK